MVEAKSQYAKEWLAEQRVLCYRLHDLKSSTINEWANDLTAELLDWPLDRPWRLLLDVRLGGGIVNAYVLSRARSIARLRPDLRGRLAILIGSKLASDIISMALRGVGNSFRQRSVFVNEALALRWLLADESAV